MTRSEVAPRAFRRSLELYAAHSRANLQRTRGSSHQRERDGLLVWAGRLRRGHTSAPIASCERRPLIATLLNPRRRDSSSPSSCSRTPIRAGSRCRRSPYLGEACRPLLGGDAGTSVLRAPADPYRLSEPHASRHRAAAATATTTPSHPRTIQMRGHAVVTPSVQSGDPTIPRRANQLACDALCRP